MYVIHVTLVLFLVFFKVIFFFKRRSYLTNLYHKYNVCFVKRKVDTLQHATLYYNQPQIVCTNTGGKFLLLWCMFLDQDYDYTMA